jgi:hypothetical protein
VLQLKSKENGSSEWLGYKKRIDNNLGAGAVRQGVSKQNIGQFWVLCKISAVVFVESEENSVQMIFFVLLSGFRRRYSPHHHRNRLSCIDHSQHLGHMRFCEEEVEWLAAPVKGLWTSPADEL